MSTRREFLGGMLAAGAALATQGCTHLSPGRRVIVDSQVHLWTAERPDWRWVAGQTPQLPEPFTIERALPLADAAGVDRIVVVPPSWTGDRNDYALEAAKRYPGRFGVMGRLALRDPAAPARLAAWRGQPGMLGVRITFIGPTEKWLDDGSADWFWPAAERAGIPVMLLAAEKGPALARIAERHPRLTLILDHMGLVTGVVRAGRTASAIDHAASLARFPNVSVKLSAAPNYSSQPYPFRDMTPHIRRLFDAYGPRRCYWGTDLTNEFARATYRQRIAHFTEELDFLSEADKDWIMGRALLERLGWS
jgi:predicted TIM-barrel fold metal-dependent hydrolase